MLNKQCTCQDCCKVFEYGDEVDNERFCRRCEAIFTISVDSDEGEFY